jgi:hypothetical protein
VSDGAPFKVGDCVRMKPDRRRFYRNLKSYSGRVEEVRRRTLGASAAWFVTVKRDGLSMRDRREFVAANWEVIPTDALTLDQTAQSLADAVKAATCRRRSCWQTA